MNNWYDEFPLVCLAPMENYTDTSCRQIVRQVAPKVVLFTEFMSVDGLFYNPVKSKRKLQFASVENPVIVQLFGNKPERFVHAAKILQKYNIAGIDINMGCPAHKVVKNQHGAALLLNPDLAWKIAEEVQKVTSLPISIKTRLGWGEADDLVSFIQGFQKRGIKIVTIHGRTYKQGFSGTANWNPIYNLKEKVDIKVIGNGDIKSGADALSQKKNLDGVMIGRGSFGNPWLLEEVYQSLKQSKIIKINPSFVERIPVILEHVRLSIQEKDGKYGVLEMRKHLAAYVKGFDGAKSLRNKLVLVDTYEDVRMLLSEQGFVGLKD